MASIPPPTSALAYPGATIVGKYRLDSLVGYGGMGSVWAATHLGLGHQIAIKLISQHHVRSTDVRRRFDTEAKAVARLKSRHVVQIYDNGELEDGCPYIAMELLHGESLHRRIHRGGPIPLPEAVTILTQVCRALSRAHAAGIVHRDIKPDNIFLAQSEEDGGYVAKVLDFGVAKLALQEGEQSSTQTGSLVGTPLYMSPEQARGLKTIDHRTDLYSLALVAYTMMTGNLAFSGDSFGDLLLKICTQELPSLQTSAPWLPPSVDAWFRKAGAREPTARFASAQEFSDALAVAAGMSVVNPGTVSSPDASGGFQKPAPVLGESITKQYQGAPRPPTTGGNGSTMTGATLHADTEMEPPLPVKRGPSVLAIAAAVVGILILGGAAFLIFGHKADPAAAASAAAVAPTATATAVPTPPAPEPPVAPAAAPATGTPETAAAATPVAKGTDAPHATTKPAGASHPTTPPPATGKATTPTKPSKPNSGTVDLGY